MNMFRFYDLRSIYTQKRMQACNWHALHFCLVLHTTGTCRQILRKYRYSKFRENSLTPLKCYTREDWHGVTNRQILATFHYEGPNASYMFLALMQPGAYLFIPNWENALTTTTFHTGCPMNQYYERWMGTDMEEDMVYLTLLFRRFLKWLGHNNQCRSPHEYEKGCYCCVDPRDTSVKTLRSQIATCQHSLICTTGDLTFQLLQTFDNRICCTTDS